MDVYKEPIHYQDPVLCIKVWQLRCRPRGPGVIMQNTAWHYHKEVEFLLIQEGTHQIQTPNRTYELHAGDVMVIGSSQLHRGYVLGSEELVYIVLHVDLEPYFDPAMMMYYRHFSEVHHPLEELNYMFDEKPDVRKATGRIIERIHEEILGRVHGYEIAASMHIKHLLLTLLRGDSRGLLKAHEFINADVMKLILEYVDRRLTDKIELEQVSKLAGMSYSYFSKYFKKTMGTSFTEYVNRKRIAKAERLLVMSSDSVSSIARDVGIENMSHFYELFNRYNGCTPKQFLNKVNAVRN